MSAAHAVQFRLLVGAVTVIKGYPFCFMLLCFLCIYPPVHRLMKKMWESLVGFMGVFKDILVGFHAIM